MALGEKLKQKKTTTTELPEDVIRKEVLTRLPIKSVARFKSVSKSWLSLFSQPKFIKEHLARSATQDPIAYDCLIAEKETRIIILSRYKESFVLPSDNYNLIGSVQGLVCLSRGVKLSLWNPAIHQSKEFFLPPRCRRDHIYNIGLGFDPASNSYKVVVLSVGLRSATVYSSCSDSWFDIIVPEHVFPKNRGYTDVSNWSIKKHTVPTTIVKDCPYWTFVRYADRPPFSVQLTVPKAESLIAVKFDVGSNKFKSLLEFYFDLSAHKVSMAVNYEIVEMNDCFTVMVYDGNSSYCMVNIYSLNEEEGCGVWTQIFSIGALDFDTQSSNVSMLHGFKYGAEIVFHDGGTYFCYDHRTDTVKRLRSTTISSIAICFRYTPSLVFLEGMKSVHLTTQTRTPGLCSRTPRRLINSLRD